MSEVKYALLARVEAKAGKEVDVENFLKSALSLAQQEAGTVEWFAIKIGSSTFGIFDTFKDEAGRDAHLNGPIAAALMANASTLLSTAPIIEKCEVLAVKPRK